MNVKEKNEKAGLKLNIQKLRSCHPVPSLHGKQMEKQWQNLFYLDSKITADVDCSHGIKTLAPWKKSYGQHRQCIKKQRHYFAYKVPYSQSYGFSSSHVQMSELDHTELTKELMLLNWGVGEDS